MSKCYRIVVLGSTGMLGYALGRYFDSLPNYEAYLSYRDPKLGYGKNNFQFDAVEYVQRKDGFLFNGFDYVINCIGGIKQHGLSDNDLSMLNTIFPIHLSVECSMTNTRLIHVSTDCVFSGKKGTYLESDVPDPVDMYGITKLIGEPTSHMVLRTSLIGEELHTNVSLLGWAKSQAGKSVRGFTNHIWNGVTTTQFARCCDEIITKDLYVPGLRHIFNPTPVSKAEMLEEFNSHFDLGLKIEHVDAEVSVNRTLATQHTLCQQLSVPDFRAMVATM